jgi:phage terminase small subunit
MPNLTPQQLAFAQAVAGGKTQSDAYREAYPRSLKWPDKTLWSKASELMANGRVLERVQSLRRPAVERAELSVDAHIAKLAEIRDAALQAFDFGPAVRAEIARGQVGGHYIQKTEVVGSVFGQLSAQTKADMVVLLLNEKARRDAMVKLPTPDIEDVEAR